MKHSVFTVSKLLFLCRLTCDWICPLGGAGRLKSLVFFVNIGVYFYNYTKEKYIQSCSLMLLLLESLVEIAVCGWVTCQHLDPQQVITKRTIETMLQGAPVSFIIYSMMLNKLREWNGKKNPQLYSFWTFLSVAYTFMRNLLVITFDL